MLFVYDPATGQHVYRQNLTTPRRADSDIPRHTHDSSRPSFVPGRSSQDVRETRHSGQSSSSSFLNSFLDDEPKRSNAPAFGAGDWGETGGFLAERKGTKLCLKEPRPSFTVSAAALKAQKQEQQQVREQRLREEESRREKMEQRRKAEEESSGGEGFGHEIEVAEQQQRGAPSPRLGLPPSTVVTQHDDDESKSKEAFHGYIKGVRHTVLEAEGLQSAPRDHQYRISKIIQAVERKAKGRSTKTYRRVVQVEQHLLAMLAGPDHQDMQNTRSGVGG
ncbi:hypothetical protein LTR10_014961 [Elasticomyces elasticus]|nr:hypothetical protein LTR10_014961 [Elasticomyces elasticus]KAK4964538.1 hypothetical protein LTR42_012834 [Elasticomyces elasticus]